MRDRRVRYVFILLILAFPMGIDAVGGAAEQHSGARAAGATARASFDPYASWRVHATQAVLIAGLMIAGRERLRLEAKLGRAHR
jgi:hypothetical protein